MHGWDDWTGERARDRARAAQRNARLRALAERWGPVVEDGLHRTMARYLELRFPDPERRPRHHVVSHTETPDQHGGSPRSVTWIAVVGDDDARAGQIPDLGVTLVSFRDRFWERVRFRLGTAEHAADAAAGRWLEARLAAWLAEALREHL